MKGAWLIKIGDVYVSTIKEAKSAFQSIHDSGSTSTTLIFAHPEVRPTLSHDGLLHSRQIIEACCASDDANQCPGRYMGGKKGGKRNLVPPTHSIY